MQEEKDQNPFQAPMKLFHVEFETRYKNINFLDLIFEDDTVATSSYELNSETVESMPEDLWCYICYYSTQIDQEYILNKAGAYIESDIKIYEESQEDWVSKVHEQAKPIISGNFFVANSSLISECPENLIPLEINAGRAFGTGEHQTTFLCLSLISDIDFEAKNIIDIGTGSGILAIGSKKLWPMTHIVGTDIDKIAIEVAKENSTLNNVSIDYFNDFDTENSADKYELVISNILAKPLIEMSDRITKITKSNGRIILSGFIQNQLSDIKKAYISKSCLLEKEVFCDDWAALQFIKKY